MPPCREPADFIPPVRLTEARSWPPVREVGVDRVSSRRRPAGRGLTHRDAARFAGHFLPAPHDRRRSIRRVRRSGQNMSGQHDQVVSRNALVESASDCARFLADHVRARRSWRSIASNIGRFSRVRAAAWCVRSNFARSAHYVLPADEAVRNRPCPRRPARCSGRAAAGPDPKRPMSVRSARLMIENTLSAALCSVIRASSRPVHVPRARKNVRAREWSPRSRR